MVVRIKDYFVNSVTSLNPFLCTYFYIAFSPNLGTLLEVCCLLVTRNRSSFPRGLYNQKVSFFQNQTLFYKTKNKRESAFYHLGLNCLPFDTCCSDTHSDWGAQCDSLARVLFHENRQMSNSAPVEQEDEVKKPEGNQGEKNKDRFVILGGKSQELWLSGESDRTHIFFEINDFRDIFSWKS